MRDFIWLVWMQGFLIVMFLILHNQRYYYRSKYYIEKCEKNSHKLKSWDKGSKYNDSFLDVT